MFAEFVEFAHDLCGEFACGCEDECLGGDVAFAHVEEWEAEGGGFAGTGFRLAEDVFAGEDFGDEFSLDVCGVDESGFVDAFEDGVAQAEVVECDVSAEDVF